MMTSIESYLSKGRRQVRHLAADGRVRLGLKIAGYFAAGFFLSAAGLAQACQPLPLGLVLALGGWPAVPAASSG